MSVAMEKAQTNKRVMQTALQPCRMYVITADIDSWKESVSSMRAAILSELPWK